VEMLVIIVIIGVAAVTVGALLFWHYSRRAQTKVSDGYDDDREGLVRKPGEGSFKRGSSGWSADRFDDGI